MLNDRQYTPERGQIQFDGCEYFRFQRAIVGICHNADSVMLVLECTDEKDMTAEAYLKETTHFINDTRNPAEMVLTKEKALHLVAEMKQLRKHMPKKKPYPFGFVISEKQLFIVPMSGKEIKELATAISRVAKKD